MIMLNCTPSYPPPPGVSSAIRIQRTTWKSVHVENFAAACSCLFYCYADDAITVLPSRRPFTLIAHFLSY